MGIASYIGSKLFGSTIIRAHSPVSQQFRSPLELFWTTHEEARDETHPSAARTDNPAPTTTSAPAPTASGQSINTDLNQDQPLRSTQAAGHKRSHSNISDPRHGELSAHPSGSQNTPDDPHIDIDLSTPIGRIDWNDIRPPKTDVEEYKRWKWYRRQRHDRIWESWSDDRREEHREKKRRKREAKDKMLKEAANEEALQPVEAIQVSEAEDGSMATLKPPNVPRLVEVLGAVIDRDEIDTQVPDETESVHTTEEDREDFTAAEMAVRMRSANHAKALKHALATYGAQAAEAAKAVEAEDADEPQWNEEDFQQAIDLSRYAAIGKVAAQATQQLVTPPSSSEPTIPKEPRYVELQPPPITKPKPAPQARRSQPARLQPAHPQPPQSVLSQKPITHSAHRFRAPQAAQRSTPRMRRRHQEQNAEVISDIFSTIASDNTLPMPRTSESPPPNKEDWIPTSAQPRGSQRPASSISAAAQAAAPKPPTRVVDVSSSPHLPHNRTAPTSSNKCPQHAPELSTQQPRPQPDVAPIFPRQSRQPASARLTASQPTVQPLPSQSVGVPSASAPELQQPQQPKNYDAYQSLTRSGQVKRKAEEDKRKAEEDRARREELERKQAEKEQRKIAAARFRQQNASHRGASSYQWSRRSTTSRQTSGLSAVQLARRSATMQQSRPTTTTSSRPYISLAAGMTPRNQRQATPTAPLAMRLSALHQKTWHALDMRDQLRERSQQAAARAHKAPPPVQDRRSDRPSWELASSRCTSAQARRRW